MVDLEILKKQNNLLVDEYGIIYVKPINEFDYVTFPIEDLSGAVALNKEEYLGLRANYYKFNKDLTGIEVRTY